MKTLRDAKTAKELIERINKLQPTNSGLWGTMEVTQMLHHCSKAIRATLDAQPSGKPSSIKQRSLKFLFLNILQRFQG